MAEDGPGMSTGDDAIPAMFRDNAFRGCNLLYGNALRENVMRGGLPARFTSNAPVAKGSSIFRAKTEYIRKGA